MTQIELTENEWLAMWAALSFLIGRYEPNKEYYTGKDLEFVNKTKLLANKIHPLAFPLLYKYPNNKHLILLFKFYDSTIRKDK